MFSFVNVAVKANTADACTTKYIALFGVKSIVRETVTFFCLRNFLLFVFINRDLLMIVLGNRSVLYCMEAVR